MGSALWAGISGLNASAKQLDVISNNLANVNTIGFKSGTTYFADVLSSSLSGGSSGSMQVGRGVSVTSIQTQFGSGSFETTGNATDVAIDGDGFFMVNDSEGATYYTRAGAFHLNADGLMVDTNDYKVQGQIVVGGDPIGPLTDINLSGVQSSPVASETFSLGANLNATTAVGGQYNTTQTVYDSLGAKHTLNTTFTKTEESANGAWAVQVALDSSPATMLNANGYTFDSDGNMEGTYTGTMGALGGTLATTGSVLERPGMVYKSTYAIPLASPAVAGPITLTRTAGAAGSWSIATVANHAGYENARVTSETTGGVTTLSISLDGTGTADVTITGSEAVWAAAAGGGTITVPLTNTTTAGLIDVRVQMPAIAGGATIGDSSGVMTWDMLGTNALTISQYASASVIRSITADGYASGQLKSLSIDDKGKISGFFTNGQTSELAQIILASFPNPTGLKKMGSNLFGETIVSGSSIRNTPGDSGMGSLSPNTLEMSNTDIATEFIKMITAQKAYQANAKVVTTEDSIMQVLMNLKQ